jgi:hypothetical protein
VRISCYCGDPSCTDTFLVDYEPRSAAGFPTNSAQPASRYDEYFNGEEYIEPYYNGDVSMEQYTPGIRILKADKYVQISLHTVAYATDSGFIRLDMSGNVTLNGCDSTVTYHLDSYNADRMTFNATKVLES